VNLFGAMQASSFRTAPRLPRLDYPLLVIVLTLICLGLVMVSSASVTLADRELGQPFYYTLRQAIYIGLGLLAGAVMLRMSLQHLERASAGALLLALGLLLIVLIPGIGHEVNGSVRWIDLGPFRMQVSEPAKLLIVIYLSGYLVRHAEEIRSQLNGFLKPMAVVGLAAMLLLGEPDFGAAVVLVATSLCIMFLAGVRLLPFGAILGLACMSLAGLAVSSPYRMARLTTFMDPWADPYRSGFQLTQSLIAIGRGEWLGVGLGASIQKLFYLPEAHTDFVFAVLAEELGLLGVMVVIALYAGLVWRAFSIAGVAQRGGREFAAYLAYGVGVWIGLQSFVNIGVNMGLLPTKGLTLPLLSYGGSSMIVMCVAVGLLLRIDYETRCTLETLAPSGIGRAMQRGNPRA
jgi:cell division protein FtsW